MTSASRPTGAPRRWRPALIVGVCAALLAACGVVTYTISTHRDDETSSRSANDTLLRGYATSSSSSSISRRLSVGAELINTSPVALEVAGPLHLSGVASDAGVQVLFAQLIEDPTAVSGIPTDAPPPLTTIPAGAGLGAGAGVSAVVGMAIDCGQWEASGGWPSAETTLTIELTGFDAPASYSFLDLFGAEVPAQISDLCAQT